MGVRSHRIDFSEGVVRDKAFDLLCHYGAKSSGAFGDMFIPCLRILESPHGDDWNGWHCRCMDVTGKQACTKPNCEGGFSRVPPWEMSPGILAQNVTKNGVGPTTFKLLCYRLIKLTQRGGEF